MTDTNLFKSECISLEETKENFFKILYKNKRLSLELEDVTLPFGVDHDKWGSYVAIEIGDDEASEFIKKIEEVIETQTRKLLNNDELVLKSQIRFSKWGWIVKSKVPKNKYGTKVDCYDKENRRFSIYDLNENQEGCNVILYIQYIWIQENKIFYKWNLKKIML